MEFFWALIFFTALCFVICVALDKRKTEITVLYIPKEDENAEDARHSLFCDNLRGSKIIIVRTGEDEEDIIRRFSDEYGRIYKKG